MDCGDRPIGRVGHGEFVTTRAQQYFNDFEVAVRDACGHHPQSSQAGRRQDAGIRDGTPVVECRDRIQRGCLVDEEVAVELAGGCLVRLTGQQHGLNPTHGAGTAVAVDGQRAADYVQVVRSRLRGHPGTRGIDLAGIAGNAEVVAAQTAEEGRRHIDADAQHEEGVVAFSAIDLQGLNREIGDSEPGSRDFIFRHDDIIAELGADNERVIGSVAAMDLHLGIVHVAHRIGLGRIGQGEGADLDPVVTFSAVEFQIRQVVVDHELVAARASFDPGGVRDPVAQESARDLDRREDVLRGDIRCQRRPLGRVELADLEPIRPAAAIQNRQ